MTTNMKTLIAAASLSTGVVALFGMFFALGNASLSYGAALDAMRVMMIAGFALLGLMLAFHGRSHVAVVAFSLALTGAYHHITATPLTPGTMALASVAKGDTASVKREWDGHFRAYANVNGKPVEMLVDTGASLVLLTWEDAQAAGLDMDALKFNAPILTANGRSHVATIELASVTVDGVGASKIKGAVAKPGMLHASLLGMSFLGAIEEAVIRKDQLILKN